MNEERAKAIAIEAAEQSERMDVPSIAPLESLKDCLSEWDERRKLLVCLEREAAEPLIPAMQKLGDHPLAVLVGPEGGFSPGETQYMKALPFVIPVSLGVRILRAETAMIAALATISSCRA
jgi:16S rRNA (uracil1498-N3)-methyltransferase